MTTEEAVTKLAPASRRWNNSQIISVTLAVLDDRRKGYAANAGIRCPVCDTDSLDYDQLTMMDAVAWCRICKTGYQEGRGKEMHDRAQPPVPES